MTAIRFASTGHALRLRALRDRARMANWVPGPGRDCTGNPLAERLGIAALYAGQGDQDNARAAALLALAGVSDSPEHRAELGDTFDQVAQLVRAAIEGASTRLQGACE